jgi:tRNA modification GTPase
LEFAAELSGYPVTFVDTAGIRSTLDEIEIEGMARAKARSARADLVLWLADQDEITLPPEASNWKVLPVRTKTDLASRFMDKGALSISVKTGDGVGELLARITDFAVKFFEGSGRLALGTERQQHAAEEAISALKHILEEPCRPVEVIADDLRIAVRALGRISGRIEIEEVLGEIFSRLCVGK